MKELSEMSLEELWQLFPIILEKNNTDWVNWYEEEKTNILLLASELIENIDHIGSTAIKGICAKPIIDILLQASKENFKSVVERLQTQCTTMNKSKNRVSLVKGYTLKGYDEKVFHLHIRISGDCDEIYFRNFLNANSDVAKQYEKLKISLAKKYIHNRDRYTEEKTDFVKLYTEKGKTQQLKNAIYK